VGTPEFSLSFDAAPRRIVLSRGEEALLTLPADGLQLGRVDEVSDGVSYDPWPLIIEDPFYDPPDGLRWLPVAGARLVEQGEGWLRATLRYEDQTPEGPAVELEAELRLEAVAPGRFRLEWTPVVGGEQVAYLRLRPRVGDQQAF
jgi:hypothetical protein